MNRTAAVLVLAAAIAGGCATGGAPGGPSGTGGSGGSGGGKTDGAAGAGGAPACGNGTVACGSACVEPAVDPKNCGACGKACAPGEVCAAGKCEMGCTGGTMKCGAKCADPGSDPQNCGGCGKACAPAEVCAGGVCALNCGAGTTKCAGKCVDPQTDPQNCGGCDKKCGAADVCSAGACKPECAPPTTKCGTKCTDTASDAQNCGGCGKACPGVQNGAAGCKAGGCVVASCNPPYKDCDGLPGDGCETNSSIDAKNCGACAMACPSVVNGSGACKSGTCGIGACDTGFADCNGGAADGCETATANDTKNCGGCGKACSAQGTVAPACSGGVCTSACFAGFADCNGDKQSDGCETNVGTDPKNCGKCGNVCTSGNCGAQLVAPMTSSPSGWKFNGSAYFDSAAQSGVITQSTSAQVGSIVYGSAIVTDSFTASFDFKIGGGTGADGMGFMIQTNGASALGNGGGGVGIAGLTGYGVELDTYNNALCGESTANHAAIDNLADCGQGQPTMLSVNSSLPFNLRETGWHGCIVQFSGGVVTVTLDGWSVLGPYGLTTFPSGTKYFYGFGAASGGSTDRHEIRNVKVTFPTARCL